MLKQRERRISSAVRCRPIGPCVRGLVHDDCYGRAGIRAGSGSRYGVGVDTWDHARGVEDTIANGRWSHPGTTGIGTAAQCFQKVEWRTRRTCHHGGTDPSIDSAVSCYGHRCTIGQAWYSTLNDVRIYPKIQRPRNVDAITYGARSNPSTANSWSPFEDVEQVDRRRR